MKKLFVFLAAALLAVSASAQNLEKSKALDNWYIGGSFGAQVKTTGVPWMKNLNPTFGIRAGKNITPVFGLALDGVAAFRNKPFESNGNFIPYMNWNAMGTFNFMNAFRGYPGEPRKFEITALYGVGWFHTFGTKSHSKINVPYEEVNSNYFGRINRISSKIALDFAYNFGAAKQFQLYLEPSLTYLFLGDYITNYHAEYGYGFVSSGDQPTYNLSNSIFQLSLGFLYKFKTSNGTHNFKYATGGYSQADIDALKSQIKDLQNRKPETITKEVASDPITKEISVKDLVFVTFAQGSSQLTSEAKNALDAVPEGRHVQIVGTASPEGDAELNQRLSENRANNVADYLKERGVLVDSAQGLGVQSSTSNRLAIVYVK